MKSPEEIAQEVAPSTLSALCPAGVVISKVSLQFTEEATEETVAAVDRLLEEVGQSHLYLVGAYYNYLYRTQGETATRQRMEASYAPETIKVAMWVDRQVAVERRLIAPSWSHARIVAGLEPGEQEHWLTRAREENLNTRQLRAELRQREAIGRGAPSQAPADEPAARASQAWEVFRAWYAATSPEFTADQREEWNEALLPLVTDAVTRMGADDFERLCAARLAFTQS